MYTFDIRYQKTFTAAQPKKVEFKLDAVVLANVIGFSFVLITKLLSVNNDGQSYFDLS